MAKADPPSAKAVNLGQAKLKSSGLDPSRFRQFGVAYLDGQQVLKLNKSFKPLCALRINYYDHNGEPLGDIPHSKPFYRLRYLEVPADFAALTDKKPVRYVQEPNTAPVAYYPRNFNWEALIGDVNQPLIITEGELKAMKACEEGFPTLGLGGVYNWRSHKLGIEWLPSLDPIQWVRRNVYICFDSDYRQNIMVCAALKDLADALHRRGAFVLLVTLPKLPNLEKVGLDDFLIHSSAEQFRKLLHDAEPLGLTRSLFEFNEQYVYIRDPGLIVNQRSHAKITPAAFRDHLKSTSEYEERELKKDGVSYKTVAAAPAWLRWPLRCEAEKITYAPGQPRFITNSPVMFNSWRGWGVEPAKGDVKPFMALLKHLFTGAEPEALEWFLNWCAYPLQYPGTKMFSSVLIHGRLHGTGKSFVGYTLGKIYGENFTEIDQGDLHSAFNEWAEGKQFVMGDDITGSNKRSDADTLKKRITQQKIRINAKYVPSYSVPDCINYFFTANQPDAFFLEDDDRRHFIHQVLVKPLDEGFYKEYELWLETGGAAAVFHHLLKHPLGDFNPSAPAFRTAAKDRMTAVVQSDLASWVRNLQQNPDHVLMVGEIKLDKDLFTSRELLQLYDPFTKGITTANGVARELARAGVEQVVSGRPLKLADGSQARYYAVRNIEKWSQAKAAICTDHLNRSSAHQKSTSHKKY